ncbi:hypothetical protein BBP40_011640 [Aspergillus hancockii]|nr:hypothetical protein BBP40_011640 [Aspergillus hancockii]
MPLNLLIALTVRATSLAPVVSHPTSLSHTSFNGIPSVIRALSASSIGTGVPSLGILATATTYPSDGKLHEPQPGPYVPVGGAGTGGETPVYNAKSDFDYESLALALYQEYIELDLFHDGLARFSEEDFTAAGLTAEDRYLIEFMADQEVGHATMLTNILGARTPKQCTYNYPHTTVQELRTFAKSLLVSERLVYIDFWVILIRGEAATLLLQSITTEARQQMVFRQFEGLFPKPVWFEVGVPQSWAWTLLAPYISSCPANQTRSVAQNETLSGGMNTLSNANIRSSASCLNSTTLGTSCHPAITHNRTQPLSWPGREVLLHWDTPGQSVGPNNIYVTSTTAGDPKFVAWVTHLNVTYSPLNVTGDRRGKTIQPDVETFSGDPTVNGTMFIAITDSDSYLTPFNLTSINPHMLKLFTLYFTTETVLDMEAPRNRKQRRAAAAASQSDANDAFDPSSIPMAHPPRDSAKKSKGKTLVDLISERQNELLGQANLPTGTSGGTGTRFMSIDPASGEISNFDASELSGEQQGNNRRSSSNGKAGLEGGQGDVDASLPPFIDTILLSVPLTTLHMTLAYLAAHQYAETIPLDKLIRESAFVAFPILTFAVHLAHGHIVSFGDGRNSESVSLFPWSRDKLSMSVLRKLLFPPTWRTLFFLPLAIFLGAKLMAMTNDEPYYAIMKRAPSIGTLWVWSILEIPVGAAVLGAVGPMIWGVWWKGYGIM